MQKTIEQVINDLAVKTFPNRADCLKVFTNKRYATKRIAEINRKYGFKS